MKNSQYKKKKIERINWQIVNSHLVIEDNVKRCDIIKIFDDGYFFQEIIIKLFEKKNSKILLFLEKKFLFLDFFI